MTRAETSGILEWFAANFADFAPVRSEMFAPSKQVGTACSSRFGDGNFA
jgi:hypothetical protein